MAKIYVDTNRFIDFYRAAHDKIDVLDKLQKHKGSLVLTEQTIMEFRRNRVSTLREQLTLFRNSIQVSGPHATPIMKVLPGHKELTDLIKTYRKKGKELLQPLEKFITHEKEDPVAQKFMALARDGDVKNLPLTDQAIAKAHRRMLLGNPPRSQDKRSVGDEVIWELLLDGLEEDLIIVTKDRTFKDNFSLLSEEYEQQTGSKLLPVTEKFTEALEGIGQQPSRELIEEEDRLIEEEKKLPDLKWSAKGIGRHAAALWNKVDDLIRDYTEDIEVERGVCLSGDESIIPIMRGLASLINSRCDEVEAEIRDGF